ncbi:MAG: STAS domain-containing protein [Ignavibacteria bacterium]
MLINEQNYKVFPIDDDSVGLAKSQDFKLIIEKELKSGNILLAFDFSKLNSINSAGLGVLIGILRKVKEAKGSLKLLNLNDRVLNIFKITKLDTLFDIN